MKKNKEDTKKRKIIELTLLTKGVVFNVIGILGIWYVPDMRIKLFSLWLMIIGWR